MIRIRLGRNRDLLFADGGVFFLSLRRWWAFKSPWCRPLFSERYGHEKPILKLGGWRFFYKRKDAAPNA